MADEGEDLSPEQTETLLQFQDLTGIEDINRCRILLQNHSWNLESAVQDRLSEEDEPPNHHPAPIEPRMPLVNLHPANQRVFTVVRRPIGIMGWGYWIISFPIHFIYSRLLSLIRFIYRLLRPDMRAIQSDPLADIRQFTEEFEQKYGRLHPVFYQGSYSQALNEAKKNLKFLLVYLHGPDHQDTPEFCRNVLCSNLFVDFVTDQLLFWACSTNSTEGYKVSQALRDTTYPFMALIVLKENRMTVVARIEGALAVGELISRLKELMVENQGCLLQAQMDRDERHFNQTLREQQDEAYQLSLLADQEKERLRRQHELKEEEEKRLASELIQKEKEEQERFYEELCKRKETIRDNLPVEPMPNDPNTIRILLKLPNGTRLERRFNRFESIKHLHDYVFVHEAAPDDFQIVRNLPRTVLPCQPTEDGSDPPSFEEIGLGKSELLFVHDNEA